MANKFLLKPCYILRDNNGSHWEIQKSIDRGGSGEIYLVTREIDDFQAALKLITRTSRAEEYSYQAGLDFLERATNRNFPHFTKYYGNGVDEKGTNCRFFIMEYVQGPTLRDFMGYKSESPIGFLSQQPMKRDVWVEIFTQILTALDFAHHHGIIHRDLKPENIKIVQQNDNLMVKILDLGIAHIIKKEIKSRTKGTKYFVGTVSYAARGQFNIPPRIDYDTDVFQLGINTVEMITGRHPFSNDEEDRNGRTRAFYEDWATWICDHPPNLDRHPEFKIDDENLRTFLNSMFQEGQTIARVWNDFKWLLGEQDRSRRRCPLCNFDYTYARTIPLHSKAIASFHKGYTSGVIPSRLLITCPNCQRGYTVYITR